MISFWKIYFLPLKLITIQLRKLQIKINKNITVRGSDIAQYLSILMVIIVNNETDVMAYSTNECILP